MEAAVSPPRLGTPAAATISLGNLEIDHNVFGVRIAMRPVELSFFEFELMRVLSEQLDRVLPYDALTNVLWSATGRNETRRLQVLVHRLLSGAEGQPERVIVFSRDEAKQHALRVQYGHQFAATDEVIYRNFQRILQFWIGDVRDFHSVAAALRDVDIAINAAALKQVPTCEYFPFEAVQTNIGGPQNIVRAIQEHNLPVQVVAGVSTDKACKPVNAMGMTKALQERVFVQGNLACPQTRFVCVRYGNVLASRGSVIPLFHEQIRQGGPVTITTRDMTRFLLSLEEAADTVFTAIRDGLPGETYVPQVPSARVTDIAAVLIGERQIEQVVTGIRPGEKVHEILVSEEEVHRTVQRGKYFTILPLLPELRRSDAGPTVLEKEYSSSDQPMTFAQTLALLQARRLMVEDIGDAPIELLR